MTSDGISRESKLAELVQRFIDRWTKAAAAKRRPVSRPDPLAPPRVPEQRHAPTRPQPALNPPETAGTISKAKKPAKVKKQDWPASMPDQAKARRTLLASTAGGRTPQELAATFRRGNVDRIAELLETFVSIGQARKVDAGRHSS